VDRIGGIVKQRCAGPYSSDVTLEVGGLRIKLIADSPELIFFIPSDEEEVDLAQSIAMELQRLLSTRT
jgi:hypothetical protein